MRGLKHLSLDRKHHRHEVASFTDAWIETAVMSRLKDAGLSHLLQMRGLKREKGYSKFHPFEVASFTDAWIETDNAIKMSGLEVVASFTDAWIETLLPFYIAKKGIRRIFYRCVD